MVDALDILFCVDKGVSSCSISTDMCSPAYEPARRDSVQQAMCTMKSVMIIALHISSYA